MRAKNVSLLVVLVLAILFVLFRANAVAFLVTGNDLQQVDSTSLNEYDMTEVYVTYSIQTAVAERKANIATPTATLTAGEKALHARAFFQFIPKLKLTPPFRKLP